MRVECYACRVQGGSGSVRFGFVLTKIPTMDDTLARRGFPVSGLLGCGS